MCVTNTTLRRQQPVSLGAAQLAICPSIISQRLLGSFVAPLQPISAPVRDIESDAEFVQTVSHEKPRPKRRRKPQKPGKTAKMNDRHFVVHNYHDHGSDVDDDPTETETQEEANQRRRGGVAVAFPLRLHAVLDQVEEDGLADIVSWQAHGRCFVVHKPKEFVDLVMPRYFRQSKLTSFQRQLNLYGFARLTRGADAGGYYHELFLRGKLFLCKRMIRTKVKGTRFKAASSPEQEPDFYTMPPVLVSNPVTSDEEMSSDSSHNFDSQPIHSEYEHQMQASAMEPIPLQYAFLPPQQFQNVTSNAAMPVPSQLLPLSASSTHDQVLDEAVDELFLQEAMLDDNLVDFVHDWDPNVQDGASLQDDSQLGFLLDKLLEE